jgi:hypothetical protein
MKDTRFIELVNLYIDRQISAEETAELETEIQSSPRRRQIYQQYCHMHRATKLVYESFRANAEQPAAATAQPGSIAYFAQRRQRVRRNFWLSTAGGLAAAACAAFYFVRADVKSTNQAATQPAAAKVVVAVPKPAAPVVAATSVAAPAQPDYASLMAAMHRTETRNFALTQSPTVQPVSLFDDGVFNTTPDLKTGNGTVFPAKAKSDKRAAPEVTAFQFQR